MNLFSLVIILYTILYGDCSHSMDTVLGILGHLEQCTRECVQVLCQHCALLCRGLEHLQLSICASAIQLRRNGLTIATLEVLDVTILMLSILGRKQKSVGKISLLLRLE